jgi:hypothetical protein
MAVTCTSRATIRSFFRSSSRREWKVWWAGQILLWTIVALIEIVILLIAIVLLELTIVERLEGRGDRLAVRLRRLQLLSFTSIALIFAEILILIWREWHGESLHFVAATIAGILLVAATAICLVPVVRVSADAHSIKRIHTRFLGLPEPDQLPGTQNEYLTGAIICAAGAVCQRTRGPVRANKRSR